MSKGEILAINISPSKGASMVPLEVARLIKDKGIKGDRYEKGTGVYSKSTRINVPPELNQDREIIRDVTLIAQEAIESANHEHGKDFTFDDTRRNFLVEGLGDLNSLIGVEFVVGGIAMLGIEHCAPCGWPSGLSKKPGFMEAFQNRGGLRARVLKDGEIKVGDAVFLHSEK